jgi:hypothetical protein
MTPTARGRGWDRREKEGKSVHEAQLIQGAQLPLREGGPVDYLLASRFHSQVRDCCSALLSLCMCIYVFL